MVLFHVVPYELFGDPDREKHGNLAPTILVYSANDRGSQIANPKDCCCWMLQLIIPETGTPEPKLAAGSQEADPPSGKT